VKIAVCIKRVPEMDVRFRIASSGTGVDETGLKWDMSDFDGYAVEAALQMTEKLGSGEVVVVSLGPDAAQRRFARRSAWAQREQSTSADRFRSTTSPSPGPSLPSFRAATIDLAGSCRSTRRAAPSADGRWLLDLPCVAAASKLEEQRKGTTRRELEGAASCSEFSLPAVVTMTKASRGRAIRRSRASWRRRRSRSSRSPRNSARRASP
jgi:electron transfer flavoprotein beta subunit